MSNTSLCMTLLLLGLLKRNITIWNGKDWNEKNSNDTARTCSARFRKRSRICHSISSHTQRTGEVNVGHLASEVNITKTEEQKNTTTCLPLINTQSASWEGYGNEPSSVTVTLRRMCHSYVWLATFRIFLRENLPDWARYLLLPVSHSGCCAPATPVRVMWPAWAHLRMQEVVPVRATVTVKSMGPILTGTDSNPITWLWVSGVAVLAFWTRAKTLT